MIYDQPPISGMCKFLCRGATNGFGVPDPYYLSPLQEIGEPVPIAGPDLRIAKLFYQLARICQFYPSFANNCELQIGIA